MLSTHEISKIFKQDIREKKRAGSGSFHRKGKGVKHGITGGMRTAYDYLPAREKRKLNGAVIVINLKELMTLREFNKFDSTKQKEILEKWRENYTSKEIYTHLGIKEFQYYNLLYDLEVIARPASHYKKKNPDKKTRYLPDAEASDIIPLNELKKLDIIERYETLEKITSQYNAQSIADIWGKSPATVYTMKHSLKQRYEKNLKMQKSKEKASVKNNNNTEVDLFTAQNSAEEKNVQDTSLFNTNDIPFDDEAIKDTANFVMNGQQTVSDTNSEFDFDVEPPTPNKEIEEIKQLVLAQNKIIQEMMETQVQLQAQSLERNVQQSQPLQTQQYVAATTFETPSHESNLISVNNQTIGAMTFSYKDSKEGFLLYQDIKRFIAMLEKNPDEFEVEIKISRKE